MGLVSLTAHVAGTILTAAALNNNFNAIVNQVNGNLETINVAALAITSAKIATGAVTGVKIAMGSDAQGDILYHNGTNYARLGAGTSGQYLKTQGAGANPAWATLAAGTQTEMEAASSNTVFATPGNVNWHPGVAKAWVNFNGTGTPAVLASHNVDSSITDHGTGEYTISFTTDFSSANYAYAGIATLAGEMAILTSQTASAAGSKRIYVRHIDGSAKDPTEASLIAFGDQ